MVKIKEPKLDEIEIKIRITERSIVMYSNIVKTLFNEDDVNLYSKEYKQNVENRLQEEEEELLKELKKLHPEYFI